ncbi:MAG TPA: sulfatase-like hydrolase/transferase [Cyclobacteriaceae bacterium]|nr:sulfatase-like hydrolase/transferase [Cyclobacteriaceae bacterium]
MKERLTSCLRNTLIMSGVFSLCYLSIRLYTWISISGRLVELEGASLVQLRGFVEDAGVALSISLVVLAIALLTALASMKVATVLTYILFSMALFLGFAVNQFFVVTLTPLSADLFGYSLNDVKTTVGSSGSTLNGSALVCFFIIAAFVIVSFRMLRTNVGQRMNTREALVVLGALVVLYIAPWRIQPENYENDFGYHVAANKFRFLTVRTMEMMAEQSDQQTFAKDAYPFLHKINYSDSLGIYFNGSAEYPNLVFIIVEGLGRDFCGPHAPYGGFTPFLDSLSQKSLYWENGLSNAGRTFGAPPSILGSLPYAKLGLMGYGNAMPNHQTLISLLKPFGYTTNFFYGGNPNFDNLDLFLERQQVDFFLNESNFPSHRKKAFWGYNDADLFSTALQRIEGKQGQRLDVFLTLSTHEPFVCPDSTIAAEADKKLEGLVNSNKKEMMQSNKSVFECLLYTDNAIRKLIQGYSKRADFNKTIFLITGDHRLIPVPQDNKIKRYHVPILIYSPQLKQPQTFSSLAAHSAILPTFLSFLHQRHQMNFPEELPLISSTLPTRKDFSSALDVALIRNKNEVKDYIFEDRFLSEDRLYTILPDLSLKVEMDDSKKRRLKEKLKAFQSASIYAFDNNRLDKVNATNQVHLFSFSAAEENYLKALSVQKMNQDERFMKAKELAFAKDFPNAKAILKNVLNQSPNYHDARILLARTYAWQGKYDTARLYLDQTIRRSPGYADCYVALADIEYWQNQMKNSLTTVQEGLKSNPTDADLLARKARALTALNQNREAREVLTELIKRGVDNDIITQLKRQLK